MDITYEALKLRPICLALIVGDRAMASALARIDFPLALERPIHPLPMLTNLPRVAVLPLSERDKRGATADQLTRLFLRDGFIDRYTGEPVVYPPALFLLSLLLPTEFPYDPAWKVGVGHSLYWSLLATHDHVTSLARGGRDVEGNWVTCSQQTNEIKMNWSVNELGWRLHPAGDRALWDGLLGWFLAYLEHHPAFLPSAVSQGRQSNLIVNLKKWHRAAQRVLSQEATQN